MAQRPYAGAQIPTGLLIVSPNASLRKYLTSQLQSGRWRLDEAVSGAEGLQKAEAGQASIVLLDHALPDLHAEEFTELLRSQCPQAEVVSLHPQSGEPIFHDPPSESTLVQLTRDLERPSPLKPVPAEVSASREIARPNALPDMVGDTPPMRQLYSMIQLVAQRDTTVLLTGETGTGKDLVARALHELSLRRLKPFVIINCAAIPEALLEAELFGYVKGAFTGAVQSRIGRIHAAQGGTLFLDEIGDLPLGLQSKLLRFLEQGEVQRLGSTDTLRVDVRVVAATNAQLNRLVQEKLFREDLFYRLSVFPICLPPLRDRRADLVPLAQTFLRMYARRELALSQEAMFRLQEHNWPGNVRELRNVIERACILASQEWSIRPEHIIL
ncbi:MAG: sigma-54-dependent Fis family transcriptional regulator [Acidobacteria bacterium]|nr:sigma-54-dependent Fis family transcriptional regulator [Acidobacteriota bacterium]